MSTTLQIRRGHPVTSFIGAPGELVVDTNTWQVYVQDGTTAGGHLIGGGSGSVSSVALADASSTAIYTVSGSPVTTAGTLTLTLNTQSANKVFAGPSSGSAAQPQFRSLVTADLPSGTGTVTSVGLTSSGTYAAALTMGSAVTTSGNISVTPNVFTSTTAGVVPASGGGTTNFLRADGTWTTTPGTVTSVSGSGSGISVSPTTGAVVVSNTGVVSFNTRTGAVTLSSSDVTTALGFTPISGNQTITLSGDVTGSGTTAITTTLANTAVTSGTYGDATHTVTFTVDGKGRLTAASSNAITYPVTSVFGRTGAVVANTGDYTAAQVGLGNVTNDAQVKLSSFTAKGDLIVGTGSSTDTTLNVGTDGTVLMADHTTTSGVKWAAIGSSTVAGSNTQIQYNNAGNFGASSNFTWTDSSSTLALGGTGPNITINDATTGGGGIYTGGSLGLGNNIIGMAGNGGVALLASSVDKGLLVNQYGAFSTDFAVPVYGTVGQVLTSNGSAQAPTWTNSIQGTTGAQGIQGTTGSQGTTGIQGALGTQGATGAGTQGVQGTSGTNGSQGTTGIQGSTGVQGTTGSQGTTGAGTQGVQGTTGIQGSTGSQGVQGTTGAVATVTDVGGTNTNYNVVFTTLDSGTLTAVDVAQSYLQYNPAGNTLTLSPSASHSASITTGSVSSGTAPSLTISAGASTDTSSSISGAPVSVYAGNSKSNLAAGTITLAGGANLGSGNGGDISFYNGLSTSATGGKITFYVGDTTSHTLAFAINSTGAFGLGTTPSYGTAGQVLTTQGTTGTPYWSSSIQGTTGAQGAAGSAGSQGTAGTQGATGIQGSTGSAGAQGTTGASGTQGVQGTTGIQGSAGAVGAQGATGSTGAQGLTGSQGTTGTQGATGSSGAQGTIGATGSQGTTGTTGSQGATGSQGTTGTTGAQGTSGTNGANGSQGTTGTQGIQGVQGTTGAGTQGTSGSNGAQGVQGLQGVQGTTGTGTQGAQGTSGAGLTWATYTGSQSAPTVTASSNVLALNFGGTVNSITETGTPYGALYAGAGNTVTGASDRNIMIWGGVDLSGTSTVRTLTTSAKTDSVCIVPSTNSNTTAYNYGVVIGSNITWGGSGAIAIGYSANAGQQSTCIGYNSTTSGASNAVALGSSASAASSSGIAIGNSANASATTTCMAVGVAAAASANYTIALGWNATTANAASIAIGSYAVTDFLGEINITNARFATAGDIHTSNFPYYAYTTSNTATELQTTGGAASTAPGNYIVLSNNAAYSFNLDLVAQVKGGGNTMMWNIQFCIKRGAAAANTALVGTPIVNVIGADSGAVSGGWTVAVTADTTNGRPAIKVTGQASTNISWVANVRMTKVGY